MTEDGFRRIALALPEAIEAEHMGHPDFRVGGRIFASLWEDGQSGMVKLTPEQQEELVQAHPKVFQPVKGKWGESGATQVNLKAARITTLRPAMTAAWRNLAPKRLGGTR